MSGEALRRAVQALEGPVFAVLDGAQFKDLPDTLLRLGLHHRFLYLNRGDNHPERLVTAPALVGPLRGDVLETTVIVLGEAGPAAAVFWECDAGEEVLYRHLRGLNMVRIPKETSITALGPFADPTDGGRASEDEAHEFVLFRQADANVFGQVAPVLDGNQRARLLGPALSVLFNPDRPWRESLQEAMFLILSRDRQSNEAQRGFLTLNQDQLAAIETGRAAVSDAKVAAYLRRVAPDQTSGMTDADLAQFVAAERGKIGAYGVRREDMIARWSFMQITCPTDLDRDANVRRALSDRSLRETPDERVQALFDLRTALLRKTA